MNDLTTLPRSAYASKLAEFPEIAWTGQAVAHHRENWNGFFANRIGPRFGGRLILEIGCFDAEFLAAIAAEHPGTAFIGIDWKCKAIHDGAKRVAERELRNVVLLRTRAHDLRAAFADGELDEIWIFHPDPCDKADELKNRLLSEAFLMQANSVLKNGDSMLALKTDHPDYYQSAIDLMGAPERSRDETALRLLHARMKISFASKDYWHDPRALAHTADRLFAGKTTPFERRFIKRRKPIHYLEFRKSGSPSQCWQP